MSIKEALNRWRAQSYRNTLNRIQDMNKLACAYLAEHPADEDEPVTSEWIRSVAAVYWEAGKESYWPGHELRFSEKIGDNPGGFYIWNEGPHSHSQKPSYMPIKTRGQVRLLCRALGIELKESK